MAVSLTDMGLAPRTSAPNLRIIPGTYGPNAKPGDTTQARRVLEQFAAQTAAQAQPGVQPVQTPDFAKSLGMTEDIFRQANQAVQGRQANIQQAVGALPGQLEAQTVQALGALDARLQAALGAGADSIAPGAQAATEGMVAAGVLPFQQAIEQSGLGMQALVPTMQAGAQQFASEQELQLNALRAQHMQRIQEQQAEIEFQAALQAQQLEAAQQGDQPPPLRREDVKPTTIHPERAGMLSPTRLQKGLDNLEQFDAALEQALADAVAADSADPMSDAVRNMQRSFGRKEADAIDMSIWLAMRPAILEQVQF